MSAPDERDAGFTLIELLIAIVLAGLIAGVTVAALVTSLNVASSTTDQVNDSQDAGLISAFLFRDAQSAGATDPSTATADPNVGVSTDRSSAGWAGCDQKADLVIRFSWVDRVPNSASSEVVVTYALDGLQQLTRRVCRDGSTVDVIIGRHVTSATAICLPAKDCDTVPESVSLDVRGAGSRAPFAYTLTASLRHETQAIPASTNSSPVPLLTLGDAPAGAPCPNLALNGKGVVTVLGDVLVDASCGAAPISGATSLLQPTGAISTLPGVIDPFLGRTPPKYACDNGKNPSIGSGGGAGTVTVYPQPVTISGDTMFAPGVSVFCAGLTIDGGRVTGTDVMFFIAGGSLAIGSKSTVDLAAVTAGPDANALIWVASPKATQVTFDSGAHVSNLRGVVYAPTTDLAVSSAIDVQIGGVAVKSLTITGNGAVRLGLPIPTLTIAPAALPVAEVGVGYAATLSLGGGTKPTSWSASGLPPGISIDATTGLLSGTPTVAGTYAVTVIAFDATAAGITADFAMSVSARLTMTGPATLPNGQVGMPYTPTTTTTTGGVAPLAWSETGMAPGLTINPATGSITGSPTVAGSYKTVVYVNDALGATSSTTYTVIVNAQLAITTTTLPSGQAGIAYTPTTLASTGGTSPYSWTATGLPNGLSVVAATGVLSGTPTAGGAFSVVLTLRDAIGAVATRTIPLAIAAPAVVLAVSSPATLPNGQVTVAYTSTTMAAIGGVAPYAWSATGLPAGLVLDPTTGVISGTPTTAGAYTPTVTVTDAGPTTAQKAYSLTINPAVVVPPGCPATTTGWRGQYYSNNSLTGASTLCRDDSAINFDWASGSPATGLPTDNFSVRWTRTATFTAGTYLFTMGSDDGGRLYIDGVLVLDRWVDQSYPTPPPSVSKALTAGDHTMVMEYYERGGLAQATLTYAIQVTPPSCLVTATGWLGEYYSNVDLTGTPTVCRDDAVVNFNWGSGAPVSGVPADYFSVRWTRKQNFAAGTYKFVLGSDDGGRLYIDGVLVIDRWVDQSYPSSPPTTTQTLTAGAHTIVVEYYERGGLAQATLNWS